MVEAQCSNFLGSRSGLLLLRSREVMPGMVCFYFVFSLGASIVVRSVAYFHLCQKSLLPTISTVTVSLVCRDIALSTHLAVNESERWYRVLLKSWNVLLYSYSHVIVFVLVHTSEHQALISQMFVVVQPVRFMSLMTRTVAILVFVRCFITNPPKHMFRSQARLRLSMLLRAKSRYQKGVLDRYSHPVT